MVSYLCEAITLKGTRCKNLKKYGDYCGIHKNFQKDFEKQLCSQKLKECQSDYEKDTKKLSRMIDKRERVIDKKNKKIKILNVAVDEALRIGEEVAADLIQDNENQKKVIKQISKKIVKEKNLKPISNSRIKELKSKAKKLKKKINN